MRAMQILALRNANETKPPFDQVVLAAPDIGVAEFRTLAQFVLRQSRHVTLYANSKERGYLLDSGGPNL